MKRALITGASSGIGRGAAVRLAQVEWHILAQGRLEDALAETLDAARAAGGDGDRGDAAQHRLRYRIDRAPAAYAVSIPIRRAPTAANR